MLTSETKRHIDSARQVLVGVVPNPTSQIDQITNALIYKFMDDMDQSAIKAGGKPSFFVGDLEKYAWTRLMDSRLGNQERMNLYSEALAKFSESEKMPDLFRTIFRQAFLPYRSPEVLGLFLKEIDNFDYTHPEELGNAYEYLLSVMSSQGDAGQFRTPRHIIEFIVDAVNPTKEDKILDPACGTGGFLVSAYNHILEESKNNKELTPIERKRLSENIEGYDIDPGMVRISQVNMYLHQFKNPKIYNYNTLYNEERWNDKFDVILANPPFMSPKGGVSPHNKFSVQSSRSEVLFVDYIMHHLKPNGRAGIIVPEGIIFQSGNAHKQLRKNLINDGLYAVISLPSGVFNPYAGVKTSILLFDNNISKQRNELLFIKIENDGFDLGATKRPINQNDLPAGLVILKKWHKGEKVESKIALFVEKSKIAENSEFNLSFNRYRVPINYFSKWQSFTLKELEEGGDIKLGRGQVISKLDLEKDPGIYPVYSSSAQGVGEFGQYGKYMFDEELITWSIDGGGRFFYRPKHKFSVTNVSGWMRVNNLEKINTKYLFRVLDSEWQKKHFDYVAKAHPSVIREIYKIPLPPLEIQEQIIAELDSYSGIISGARQIVQNWKPKIDIDPNWQKVKLGEVATVIAGQSPEGKFYNDAGEGIPFYQGKTEFDDIYLGKPKKWTTQVTKLANVGDILMSVRAPVGPVNIANKNICIGRGLAAIKAIKIESMFLFTYFQMNEKSIIGNGGAVFDSISKNQIEQLEIPFPALEIQRQIVEKIKSEYTLVESSKKLIEIYEQKIKEVISKLWN